MTARSLIIILAAAVVGVLVWSGCATSKPAAAVSATAPTVAPAPAPTPQPAATPAGWPQDIRDGVMLQCQAQIPSQEFCDCLVKALERISPDPNKPFAEGETQRGLNECKDKSPVI